MHIVSRFHRLLLLGITLLWVLGGCGSSGGSNGSGTSEPPAPAPGTTIGVKDEIGFLQSYMRDWYLWYARLPSPDTSAMTSVDQALDALRVPEDRYSFVESAQVFTAFFGEGKTVGFGIGLSIVGDALYVRLVQPNSNAAAQGLARGDRILSINREAVSTLIAENRLDAAIGPAVAGLSADLSILRGAVSLERTVVKTEYALRYVLAPTVIQNGDRRTGYLYFSSFGTPGREEWRQALAALLDQGIVDLVVDLRDNGGGLLSVAGDVASSLAPTQAAGQLAFQLQFNDKHGSSNQTFNLNTDALAGRIERLAWITGPRSCSASEALIAALLPYRSAARAGAVTCGKPVGFTPPEYNGKVFNIVSFRSSNRDGFGDYYNGLSPECPVGIEDLSTPLGDSNEAYLKAALQQLASGSCAASTTKAAAAIPQHPVPTQGLGRMSHLH